MHCVTFNAALFSSFLLWRFCFFRILVSDFFLLLLVFNISYCKKQNKNGQQNIAAQCSRSWSSVELNTLLDLWVKDTIVQWHLVGMCCMCFLSCFHEFCEDQGCSKCLTIYRDLCLVWRFSQAFLSSHTVDCCIEFCIRIYICVLS